MVTFDGHIPTRLISEIRSGNCVAFIGAGFSAPAVPTWNALLDELAGMLPEAEGRTQVRALLRMSREQPETGIFDREAAAQILEEALGEDFARAVETALGRSRGSDGTRRVRKRCDRVYRIPFKAILTTNFDGFLQGKILRDADLREIVRGDRGGWTNAINWYSGDFNVKPVLKLHGDVERAVKAKEPLTFSRAGYRKLLFETPHFQSVMKAVLATRTLLFLGVSFSDAYMNLIRSEVISMLRANGSDGVFAYAVVNDLDERKARYLKSYEGIEPIAYSTNEDGPDHEGFDRILEAIWERTDPGKVAAELLRDRRVLWFDPNRGSVDHGVKTLTSNNVELVYDLSTAMDRVVKSNHDLVLTHWGHEASVDKDGNCISNAEALIRSMRAQNVRAPVIVFASGDHWDENRKQALNAGAFEFECTWDGLFGAIERLFARREPVSEVH